MNETQVSPSILEQLNLLAEKIGMAGIVTVGTILTIVLSVALVSFELNGLHLNELPHFEKVLSVLNPLLIAPPFFYIVFRLVANLHRANLKLQLALDEVKELSGMLPICASCKKIRDDAGYWNQIEVYFNTHSKIQFSHGICPGCKDDLYGDFLKGINVATDDKVK